jgi:hypothetical protein
MKWILPVFLLISGCASQTPNFDKYRISKIGVYETEAERINSERIQKQAREFAVWSAEHLTTGRSKSPDITINGVPLDLLDIIGP